MRGTAGPKRLEGTTLGLASKGSWVPNSSRHRRREGMDDSLGSARAALTKADSTPPAVSGSPPVTLLVPDQDAASGRAARLHADLRLRDALLAEGFGGPAYAALAAYGHQLMTALVATGYIFTRCREQHLDLLSLRIPSSDQEDLVQETVAEALRTFNRNLERGRWHPEGGASLKTYFTGALFRQFANAWRKWLRNKAIHSSFPLEVLPDDPESPDPDPADVCAQRDETRRTLALEEARTQAALLLTGYGYTQDEIAEILGTTRRAVESLLRRHRTRIAGSGGKAGGL